MITDLIQILTTYGWPGLIGFLVISSIIWYMNKKDKKTSATINNGFDKLAASMAEQNKMLIGALSEQGKETQTQLIGIIKDGLSNYHEDAKQTHSDSINRRMNVSETINTKVRDILNVYNAKRAIVIEFHNSKENLAGLSFAWYDVQYEQIQRGVSPICSRCKDMQFSNIIPVVEDVIASKNGIIVYNKEDIEKLYDRSSVLYSQISTILEATQLIIAGLYKDNSLIGLIVIEYSNDFTYSNAIDPYHDMIGRAAEIQQLVNISKDELK